MSYFEDYHFLKNKYQSKLDFIPFPKWNLNLHNIPFTSQSELVFTRNKDYYVPKILENKEILKGQTQEVIKINDAEIEENRSFHYILLKSSQEIKSDELVIFFHGLNEKDWNKYLPWAKHIVQNTGKAVLMFPLAFHINRGALAWGNNRSMQVVSQDRMKLFEGLKESSFTNAAMSTRLHFAPARFFLSGLQTYNDIIQLVQYIRLGNHSLINETASIDFFGYSAGAFLAAIIMMANRNGWFSNSQAVFFCGGSMLSEMRLSSRYIMDSEAYQTIQDFYIHHFTKSLEADKKLYHLFNSTHSGGIFFRSMLSDKFEKENQIREKRLIELSDRILAIGLAKDTIIPFEGIRKTLQGRRKDIPIVCENYELPYKYSHMNPFPYNQKCAEVVEKPYQEIFSRIERHLQKAIKVT